MFHAEAFHEVKISEKLKSENLKNKKSLRSEIKTFFLVSKVLPFRYTKQTSKNVADTTFRARDSYNSSRLFFYWVKNGGYNIHLWIYIKFECLLKVFLFVIFHIWATDMGSIWKIGVAKHATRISSCYELIESNGKASYTVTFILQITTVGNQLLTIKLPTIIPWLLPSIKDIMER